MVKIWWVNKKKKFIGRGQAIYKKRDLLICLRYWLFVQLPHVDKLQATPPFAGRFVEIMCWCMSHFVISLFIKRNACKTWT